MLLLMPLLIGVVIGNEPIKIGFIYFTKEFTKMTTILLLLSVLSFHCFTTTTTTAAAAMKTRSNAPSFLLHHGPTVFF